MGKGASFIKVLGPDFSKELQIPHDFTKTFNGYIPNRFFIESLKSKKCWRVEVEKDGDGTTLLREGWAAFAEAHCLEVGDFLLFDYEEQSIFQVRIYGGSGCPKNKFVNINESQPNPPKVIDIENEISGESIDCDPNIFRNCRQLRTITLSAQKDNNGIYKNQHEVSMTSRTSHNVGENRTSFSVLMGKQHQFTQLYFPMAVGLEKKLTSQDELVLQDVEGHCWPVGLAHKKDGHVILVRGWKAFLDGNNIVMGDSLKFEFVSDTEVNVARLSEVWDQHSERRYHSKNTGSFHVECEQGKPQGDYATDEQPVEASIITKKAKCELTSSSFSFLWSRSRALRYLYIPKAIALAQKLKDKESVALRDTHGKYWPLEVKTWNDGRVALTKGWFEFWKGLALKIGDTIEFMFLSPRRIQVCIHKCEQANDCTPEEATIDEEMMDFKGSATDLLDSTTHIESMDIEGFANDLLASQREHCFLQTPPGFQPLEHHRL